MADLVSVKIGVEVEGVPVTEGRLAATTCDSRQHDLFPQELKHERNPPGHIPEVAASESSGTKSGRFFAGEDNLFVTPARGLCAKRRRLGSGRVHGNSNNLAADCFASTCRPCLGRRTAENMPIRSHGHGTPKRVNDEEWHTALFRANCVFAQIPQPRRAASSVAMSIFLYQNACEVRRSTCGVRKSWAAGSRFRDRLHQPITRLASGVAGWHAHGSARLCMGMSAKLRQNVVTARPSATITNLPGHERTLESVSTIQRTDMPVRS